MNRAELMDELRLTPEEIKLLPMRGTSILVNSETADDIRKSNKLILLEAQLGKVFERDDIYVLVDHNREWSEFVRLSEMKEVEIVSMPESYGKTRDGRISDQGGKS